MPEQTLSMAEERLANLQFSSDVEEILDRVPREKGSKKVWGTRAKCALIFGRLGLNLYKIYQDFAKYSTPGLWVGSGFIDRLTTVLPLAELIAYLVVVCSGVWGIARCCGLDPHLPYIPANNRRWRRGAMGAVRLEAAAGFSALKLLDAFRTVVPETQAKWELLAERHRAKERSTARWRAQLRTLLGTLRTFSIELGRGVVGVAAFAAKVQHCAEPVNLVEFVGFANQVVHIADVQAIQKDAVMRFMFTGQDAKWSLDEVEALREFEGRLLKRCVRHASDVPSGFTTYALMKATDVQKIVITEKA